MASAGMIRKKRPTSIAMPERRHVPLGAGAVSPAKAEPLLLPAEVKAYEHLGEPVRPGLQDRRRRHRSAPRRAAKTRTASGIARM